MKAKFSFHIITAILVIISYSSFSQSSKWGCGDDLTDPRDNQTYQTVLIGNQCWMAENLNIGDMVNGSHEMTDDGVIEKYCYGNDLLNCDSYGGLYQWDEMMDYSDIQGSQGICPSGWHLPSDGEWIILEDYADEYYSYNDPIWHQIGGRGYEVGKNLKSTYEWINGGGGIDLFGFNARPYGDRSPIGEFSGFGVYSFFGLHHCTIPILLSVGISGAILIFLIVITRPKM